MISHVQALQLAGASLRNGKSPKRELRAALAAAQAAKVTTLEYLHARLLIEAGITSLDGEDLSGEYRPPSPRSLCVGLD